MRSQAAKNQWKNLTRMRNDKLIVIQLRVYNFDFSMFDLTEEEIESFKKVFEMFDKDRNGAINRSVLYIAMK